MLLPVRSEDTRILNAAFALSGPLQGAALAAILQCHSLEMPKCAFYCSKTFSSSTWPFCSFPPRLPKRPSECHGRRCHRAPCGPLPGCLMTEVSLLHCHGCTLVASRLNPGGIYGGCRSLWASWNPCLNMSIGTPDFPASRAHEAAGEEGQADSKLESDSVGITGSLREQDLPSQVSEVTDRRFKNQGCQREMGLSQGRVQRLATGTAEGQRQSSSLVHVIKPVSSSQKLCV